MRTQGEPSGIAPSPAESEVYSVSQLNLAAYLIVAGHKLLGVEPIEKGIKYCQFVFERNDRIVPDRMEYYERRARVDARGFAEALVDLKRQAMKKLEESENNGDKDF